MSEIDPIYFDKAYYIIPTSAEKAFLVLKKAMKQENKVAIAKTVLSNTEKLVAIREQNGNLVLYTLHFFDEVQKVSKEIKDISVTKQEVDLAKQIIQNMTEHFDAKEYKDEFRQKLITAINKKIKGEQVRPSKIIAPKNVINLMDALKQSVVASKKSPPKSPLCCKRAFRRVCPEPPPLWKRGAPPNRARPEGSNRPPRLSGCRSSL